MAHRSRSDLPWQKVRESKPTFAPSFKTGGLTLGAAAYRVLGVGCVHWISCPEHQMLYSGNNNLISHVLKQVTVLVVLCAMLKPSFSSPFLFLCIKYIKIKYG